MIQLLKSFDNDAWKSIASACNNPKHPLRWPILGYKSPNGEVQQRSVVLRQIDVERRIMTFFTDYRSDKIAQIPTNGCSLLFVDRVMGLQIACIGNVELGRPGSQRAKVCAETLSERQWLDYATRTAPGTQAADPNDADQRDTLAAVDNFCVVDVCVTSSDIVSIGKIAQRARFSYDQGRATGIWVTP